MKTTWLSPAKLNLFLHITGRRPDGYHNLQTVFQFLDFSDELEFEITDDGKIGLEDSLAGVPHEDNLIIKAARSLQKYVKKAPPSGVKIKLHKKLPMGGGLGGGSSNAATTLMALNQLWELGLSDEELKKIGLQLGADVPVFIHGQACVAEGVGERFTDVSPEQCWYLVLIPDCQVNTGEIFSDLALTRNSKTIRIRAPLNWEVLESLRNDCESVVKKRYPEVNQALEWLSEYGIARMTGTGCCVFSVFPSEEEARKIATRRPKGIQAFVARGVNKSPAFRSLTP